MAAGTPSARRPTGRRGDARTVPPLPPAKFVPRPRLRDTIEGAVPLGVALMVAPGGFGKTVAMADFATNATFPVAWLTVSPADADLVAFVESLTAAIRRFRAGFGKQAVKMARQSGTGAVAALAEELARELAARDDPLGLVLDDFHHLDGVADVTRLVGLVLERLPPTCFVAVASRTLPNLPHARLLASGRMLGVAAEDLRFTRAEVAAYLGHEAEGDDAGRAHETSGGWAAALVLGGEAKGVPSALDDYLESEVLAQQPPELRDFLMRAAVPPHLTDDLCMRVLDAPPGTRAPQEGPPLGPVRCRAGRGRLAPARPVPGLPAEPAEAPRRCFVGGVAPAGGRGASGWRESSGGDCLASRGGIIRPGSRIDGSRVGRVGSARQLERRSSMDGCLTR